ncbi:MAG: aminotransferase class III-fold pyridoxal phosphate-dependent enzyme [Thermoplasmatota archaeon]
MRKNRLKEAIVYDRAKHPERTNATYERVEEVIDNVLGDSIKKELQELKHQLGLSNPRSYLNEKQADNIVSFVQAKKLPSDVIDDIIDQLQSSEISTAEAIDIHKKYKIPISHLEQDIIPVKGKGCWIMDTKGRWFLDMDSNYSATNLGMANEEIGQGLFNQAKLLISMKEDRVQIARTRFLKEISSMMPDGLTYFYWQNSGGEAVDKALKIAKAYTKSTAVIAFKQGFHGRTHGSVAVTWRDDYKKPFGLDDEDWVSFATFNDIKSVKKLVEQTGARIIILELVQGEEAGNRPADPEFVKQLWQYAQEKDLIIIDDEIQAGFGRTALKKGDWFACMSYNVTPSIMTIGKSFGGGYPVTAVVTNKKISEAMKPGYDGSTFGGNPMAMTAALIATRQMKEKDITSNVISRARQLHEGLEQLKDRYPVIEEITGRGLMIAFSVGTSEKVKQLAKHLQHHGVKTSLSTDKYIRFLPPTIISKDEVDEFLKRLDKALQHL